MTDSLTKSAVRAALQVASGCLAYAAQPAPTAEALAAALQESARRQACLNLA